MIEENFATLETLRQISVIAEGRGVDDVSFGGIVGDVKAGGWTSKQDGLDYSELLGGVSSTVPHNQGGGIDSTSDADTPSESNPNAYDLDILMEDVEEDTVEDVGEEEGEVEDVDEDEDEDEEENEDEEKCLSLFGAVNLRTTNGSFVAYDSKFGTLAVVQREAVLNNTFCVPN
jgi:hypothetical protein